MSGTYTQGCVHFGSDRTCTSELSIPTYGPSSYSDDLNREADKHGWTTDEGQYVCQVCSVAGESFGSMKDAINFAQSALAVWNGTDAIYITRHDDADYYTVTTSRKEAFASGAAMVVTYRRRAA